LLAQGTDQWNADGTVYKFTLGEGFVRVTIANEAGKIDLNRASEDTLEALFVSVGVDLAAARKLAAAVEDYRDSDDVRRPGGAEAIDYQAAGLDYKPKNAPFASIDELRRVFGVTSATFASVRPLITVYSPGADVDVNAASEAVLRALPNLDPERRQEIFAARSTAPLSRPDVVTIMSEAETSGGGKFTRDAILRRSVVPTRPYDILDWRRVWPLATIPQG
jgi:general secretion pathway protein K